MSNLTLIADACRGLLPVVRLIRQGLYPIVQIIIPIILIVYGIVDLGKAVIASDEKEIKAAQSRLIKRCIYAAAVFFVVMIVSLVMDIVSTGLGSDDTDSNTQGWSSCWQAAGKK